MLYSSFVAPYCMKWLKNIQIIRIIRIIFWYSNIRIMIFKLWILFVIQFGHFLPSNIIWIINLLQTIICGNTTPCSYRPKSVISIWHFLRHCSFVMRTSECNFVFFLPSASILIISWFARVLDLLMCSCCSSLCNIISRS